MTGHTPIPITAAQIYLRETQALIEQRHDLLKAAETLMDACGPIPEGRTLSAEAQALKAAIARANGV